MTALRHPYIDPPLVIEVTDDPVVLLAHERAGWLLHEEGSPTPDPKPTGDEGPDSPEEEK